MSLTKLRSIKDSVMTGMAGLHVIENGHLLHWKIKSFDPSLVV